MDMMRIGPDSKNLVCRNCLERKTAQSKDGKKIAASKEQAQEPSMKEYFCKACRYNFKRAKHLSIPTCPYCGASGSIMVKGSTAKIIADASKMKEDFRW